MKENLLSKCTNTYGVETGSSEAQIGCEKECIECLLDCDEVEPSHPDPEARRAKLQAVRGLDDDGKVLLKRLSHVKYLCKALAKQLPWYLSAYDASNGWMLYWITHSLSMLGVADDVFKLNRLGSRIVDFLTKRCQRLGEDTGGFGGGPQQLPHTAGTYAAVNAIYNVGREDGYEGIDRPAVYRYLLSMKDKDTGGFRMHHDGEIDIRATYCAMSVASLLNMLTPELCEGAAEFAIRCQTHEGGMGGEPYNEAHGGYAFCGLAALVIMHRVTGCLSPSFRPRLNLKKFRRWLCSRQMHLEGGFQGRTNKLVDGCYSFWQGSAAAVLQIAQRMRNRRCGKKGPSGISDGSKLIGGTQGERREIKLVEGMGLKEGEGKEGGRKKGDAGEGKDVPAWLRAPTPGEVSPSFSFHEGIEALVTDQEKLQRYILFCCQRLDGGLGENGGLRDKPSLKPDFYHTCYVLSGLSVAQHSGQSGPTVYGAKENLLVSTCPSIRSTKLGGKTRKEG